MLTLYAFIGLCFLPLGTPAPRTFLLVRTAVDSDAKQQERQLFNELAIVLDDFAPYVVSPHDFASLATHPERVAAAHRSVQAFDAAGGLWMTTDGPKIGVHVLARQGASANYSEYDITPADPDPVRLALAVRAVLGTTSFAAPPNPPPPEKATPSSEPKTQAPDGPSTHAQTLLVGSGALSRHRGAATDLGLRLSAGSTWGDSQLGMDISAEVTTTPTFRTGDTRYRFIRLAPGAQVYYDWEMGRVQQRLGIGARGEFRYATLRQPEAKAAFSSWRWGGFLGGQLGYRLSPRIIAIVAGEIIWMPRRIFYRQSPVDEALVSTPTWGAVVGLGARIQLGPL